MYKHTQIGYTAIVIVFGVMLGIIIKGAFDSRVGFDWKLHGIVGLAIVVIGGVFSTLTVRVENGLLSWNFAIPAIRNSIPLKDIRKVEIVRNPLIYGWGMHMIRGGWVYNVSGRTAVEIGLDDGTRLRLGTDEPEALVEAMAVHGVSASAMQATNPTISRAARPKATY